MLTFSVGGEALTLPAEDVAEIIKPGSMTRVPNAPSSLVGVTNFRGSVLPVVSLADGLNGEGLDLHTRRIVVIDRSRVAVGLLVDEVVDLSDAPRGKAFDLEGMLAREFGAYMRRTSARHESFHQQPKVALETANSAAAFICFTLAKQNYALPLAHVLEVTQFPREMAELPKTDAAMIGVTELRGRLVPLVALRALLGLPPETHGRSDSRVISARIGDRVVGLVVDGITSIRRLAEQSFDRVPNLLTRGSGEAQIEAICRHESGLISILAPDKLFDQRTSAQLLGEAAGETDMVSDKRTAQSEQFVLFQLGTELYGMPIASVDEIVRRPETLTRVPRAPAFVEGVMNLRGKMVPIIDQHQRFAVRDANHHRNQKIIVVTVDGVQTGLVVDRVSEILAIAADELRAAPQFDSEASPIFDRVAMIERDGRMILLVNPQALLDKAERDVLASLGNEAVEAPVS